MPLFDRSLTYMRPVYLLLITLAVFATTGPMHGTTT